MKTLILIRHASSGWKLACQTDIERTLDQNGEKEALQMAETLKNRRIFPDLYISSPAIRAVETAEFFLKTYTRSNADLHTDPALYQADVQTFYNRIAAIPDDNHTILIFSHNPGITTFINDLDCQPVWNMPTCGVYALQSDGDHWKDLRIAQKRFLFFDYPEKKE